MKSVLLRVLILMVTVIFVFGVGCEGPIGPAGPAGPEGVEGPTGADGVLTPETLSAIDQCLVSYFDALNSYAAFQETEPPVEFDVFDGMFAFPVFVEEYEYNHYVEESAEWNLNWTGSYVFRTQEELGDFFGFAFGGSRQEPSSMPLNHTMIAMWSIEGEPRLEPMPQAILPRQWIWIRVLVHIEGTDPGENTIDHYGTKDFAVSFDAPGNVVIRSLHLWAPYWGQFWEPPLL